MDFTTINKGDKVLVISLKYSGYGGDIMQNSLNDGRIYTAKQVSVSRALLDNDIIYDKRDLKRVSESPYKDTKTDPQIFNIENLEY